MTARLLKALPKAVARNPYLNLVSGAVLLVTAGCEIVRTLDGASLGIHHGIAFYAVMHILKCLPEITHGSEQLVRFEGERAFSTGSRTPPGESRPGAP